MSAAAFYLAEKRGRYSMFKAFRIRLITLTMLSITAIVFAIIGAINISNIVRLRMHADSMLNFISDHNGTIPENSTEIEGMVDFFVSSETPYQTRYFVIHLNDEGGITDTMTNYISAVNIDDLFYYAGITAELDNGTFGSIGNFRYLVRDTLDGKMITFLDRSQDINSSVQLLFLSVFIALIGLSCICVLMILLSDKLIQPFKRNHERQKQFITDAGHELKTPLAIIRTNAEVLECCYGENEWIDSIKNQTERLDGLVKGLLQLAKSNEMPNDNVHLTFPLSAAVSEIAESFVTMANQKGHELKLDIAPNIEYKGDAKAISTLVSILIDNAIKYASKDGEIAVTLTRLGKSTARTAKLIVENETNIDEKEDVNRYFERFYRSDSSRSRQTGGYGIGLSVAKTIIEAHKGKITVSRGNGRIYFTVLL